MDPLDTAHCERYASILSSVATKLLSEDIQSAIAEFIEEHKVKFKNITKAELTGATTDTDSSNVYYATYQLFIDKFGSKLELYLGESGIEQKHFVEACDWAKKKPTGQSLEKAMVTLLLSQTDYPAFLSFMTDSSR